MITAKENAITFDYLCFSLVKEGLCTRPELLAAVWSATRKVVVSNWSQGKSTMLTNYLLAGIR